MAARPQSSDLEHIADDLRRRGQRATPQRVLVLSVFHPGEHMTADEVIARVKAVMPHVDRSAVHRTLQRLRDIGILSETDLGGSQRRYELLNEQPHHHLICHACGHVDVFTDDLAEPFRASIMEQTGFQASMDHLALWGTCRACREAGA